MTVDFVSVDKCLHEYLYSETTTDIKMKPGAKHSLKELKLKVETCMA